MQEIKEIDIFDVGPQTPRIESKDERKRRKSESRDIQKLAEAFIRDRSNRNFTLLMNRCNWGLRSFIFKMTGNDYDTDNIMSLTMEHVWLGIDTFNMDIAKFSTWMYTIAYYDTLRYLKNDGLNEKLNIVSTDISDIYGGVGYEDECISDLEECEGIVDNMYIDGNEIVSVTKNSIKSKVYEALVDCMEYLPDNIKTVMVDKFINLKKGEQISSDNNMKITNVNNWLVKGRKCVLNEFKNRFPLLVDIYKETINE